MGGEDASPLRNWDRMEEGIHAREPAGAMGSAPRFWVCSSLVTVGRARKPESTPLEDWEAWRGKDRNLPCPGSAWEQAAVSQ